MSLNGIIKWYDFKKGYGIIVENNVEYFLHHSNINNNKKVYENDKVKFDESVHQNKKSAINVEIINSSNNGLKKNKKKNTENFNPDHSLPDMRIIIGREGKHTNISTRDVILKEDLFCDSNNYDIYNNLLDEIKKSNLDKSKLWKLWHDDTHLIADDNMNGKEDCPTFNYIIDKVSDYFNMKVTATRLNWYKDNSQWKPYHHDAAAIKPHIAKKQNFTVGISFGDEREAAFQHTKSKNVVSVVLKNGSLYTFSKDVNIIWKHGIPQVPNLNSNSRGRISIIAWGWVDQE